LPEKKFSPIATKSWSQQEETAQKKTRFYRTLSDYPRVVPKKESQQRLNGQVKTKKKAVRWFGGPRPNVLKTEAETFWVR